MCGIVGYVGNKQVVPVILDGLRKLEYRGYDSAGIAVVDEGQQLDIRRAEGKLRNLEEAIRLKPLDGTYGIGHTRWATHGRPTEENAHPHRDCTAQVVVTETDTEVVAHLVEEYLREDDSFEKAVGRAVRDLRGIFALSIISTDEPDTIIAADGPPILQHTRDVFFLGDGELAVLTKDSVRVTNFDGDGVEPHIQRITWDPIMGEKG